MIDLHKGARPDEQFHVQYGQPVPHVWGWKPLLWGVRWSNVVGHWFMSFRVLWFIRLYVGTSKCDGTRTRMFWEGQLGDAGLPEYYVMTTTPKERFSVRLQCQDSTPITWDSMGSI